MSIGLTSVNGSPAKSAPSWVRRILIGRRPRLTAVRIVVLVVTCLVVFKFFLLPIRISGPSMLPTYPQSGINFVNRRAYVNHEPQRGDVVAIRYAGPSIMLMKRIVGLPGETVGFESGRLMINGRELPEAYLKMPCNWNRPSRTLEADEYFVVGDNRSMPPELHYHGAAKRQRIVGKVLL